MNKNNFCFSHTAYCKIDSKGSIISDKISVSPIVDYKKLLKHNEIGCLTAMYDTEILGKYMFPTIGHEDFATWLKILKNGCVSHGLDIVLASYRVHLNTVSSNKLKAATYTWRILRNEEKMPIYKALYYFSFYMTKALSKYLKR